MKFHRHLVVMLLTNLITTSAIAAEPPRLPRDNLMLFRDDSGRAQPVKSLDDWARRRAEIFRGIESVMGKLPVDEKRIPLDMQVDEEFDGGDYIRRHITYASEPDCRTPAYLLIPKAVLDKQGKAPAVLALHGTNIELGHGIIVGAGVKQNPGYGVELVRRGYVVLAPAYPTMGGYNPDIVALGWESGSLKAVWDNIRGLDLLETLPFVEGKKFGSVGHSLGGHNSVYTAVFDPRIVAVASSCGLDSYLDYYGGDPKRWDPEQGWCQTRYMLKLANYKGRLEEIPFDFHELIATLAPRHMLIIAPTKDGNFRADSVDRVAKAASEIYKLQGHPDRLRVLHPDCGHDFPPEMREEAYKLFDAVLKGR